MSKVSFAPGRFVFARSICWLSALYLQLLVVFFCFLQGTLGTDNTQSKVTSFIVSSKNRANNHICTSQEGFGKQCCRAFKLLLFQVPTNHGLPQATPFPKVSAFLFQLMLNTLWLLNMISLQHVSLCLLVLCMLVFVICFRVPICSFVSLPFLLQFPSEFTGKSAI